MYALTMAIERQRWDVAALLLVQAMLNVVDSVPPDALQGLLEVLEGDTDAAQG